MTHDNEYFYCYTKKLSLYLSSQGFHYIIKARSIKDNTIFTLYERTDELQQALEQLNK